MDKEKLISCFWQKWPKITNEDFEGFGPEDWMHIWNTAPRKKGASKFAEKKIIETATDFNTLQWHIKRFWLTDDPIKKVAFKKMAEIGTFQDWRDFYCQGTHSFVDFAIEQMTKLGKFKDWLDILLPKDRPDIPRDLLDFFPKEPKRKNKLRTISLQKLNALGTFSDWLKVYREKHGNDEIHEIALEKMRETAKTPEQWQKIFEITQEPKLSKEAMQRAELHKLAKQKLKELGTQLPEIS
jgi:hypothetical protein